MFFVKLLKNNNKLESQSKTANLLPRVSDPDNSQTLMYCSLARDTPLVHANPFITLQVILVTDKQTDKQTIQHDQKHNLLAHEKNQHYS